MHPSRITMVKIELKKANNKYVDTDFGLNPIRNQISSKDQWCGGKNLYKVLQKLEFFPLILKNYKC